MNEDACPMDETVIRVRRAENYIGLAIVSTDHPKPNNCGEFFNVYSESENWFCDNCKSPVSVIQVKDLKEPFVLGHDLTVSVSTVSRLDTDENTEDPI